MTAKLGLLALLLVQTAYCRDEEFETFVLGVPYGPGITINIRLNNPDKATSYVVIQRYTKDGTLLHIDNRPVVGKSSMDVQLDNSSNPDVDEGWMRVLATSKKPIEVQWGIEETKGNELITLRMHPVLRVVRQ